MKACARCRLEKPETEFHKNSTKADGLQNYCKTCSKDRGKAYYQIVRPERVTKNAEHRSEIKEAVLQYLLIHPCVDCGEKDPVVLDFDHVRGKKTKAVMRMVFEGFSWERIAEEISKCDVRCANCHRRATARRSNSFKHSRIA